MMNFQKKKKQHWIELDWEGGDAPEEVSASKLNKELFNTGTVDKMLPTLNGKWH